jgi:hypothetical protein
VTEPALTTFLAECFWTDVTEEDVRDVDRRAEATVAELARGGQAIRYLGSILIRQDEVLLCLFEGSHDAVEAAATRAGIPFERILEGFDSTRRS